MHRETVHAVTHLGLLVRDAGGLQPAIRRPPRAAAVVAPKDAGRRDRRVDAPGTPRIQQDRVEAQTAGARLPGRPRGVPAQRRELLPRTPAVRRPEQRRVLHPRVHRIGIGPVRLQVPDAGELPGMRRAVVPLVRAGLALVLELVAHGAPGAAAVVGTLDDLPEPVAVLRGVQPLGVGRRALDVKHLPPGEVRAVHAPPAARPVGGQQERALAGTDQNPNRAHRQACLRQSSYFASGCGRTWNLTAFCNVPGPPSRCHAA